MLSKRLPETFLLLISKGPEPFTDVSGRGGAREAAQGQMPSKRWPEIFTSLEPTEPEHFRGASGRGERGPGPDAFKMVT